MSAIEVLNNYWKYVHSKDTLDFDSEFHNAINEALLALEQKEKFVKILRDINYLMEGKDYIEVISFTNRWIKELEEGVEK